ncbi:MAG: hypothetical protein RQ866_08405, partial [Bacteroidales bacterium]|nr:hypothetical protein [Bacteroidales bacterium]
MKKLAFLLTAVIITALSSNAFGQSSGTAPAPGAIHNYSVTDHSGSTYAWSVTRGDLITVAVAATLTPATGNSIDIEWADTVTVGTWFYVHVVEDDGSCTNEKVLPVQITASPFYLVLSGATASCYDDNVSITLSGTDPQYNHGDATITYTITPAGVNGASDGYEFNFVTALSKFSSSVGATSSNGTMTGTLVEVDDDQ